MNNYGEWEDLLTPPVVQLKPKPKKVSNYPKPSFKKGSFYAHMNPPKKDSFLEQRTGWICDGIGYDKNEVGAWAATDILSGAQITHAGTRQECYEWICENQQLIKEQKEKEKYKNMVQQFNVLRSSL